MNLLNIWNAMDASNFWSGLLLMIIGALCTLFISFFNKIRRKIANLEIQNEAARSGTEALLRSNIIEQYEKYMKKEYCPLYARENVEKLYNSYHTLGGNGVIDGLIEKLFSLPTEPHSN